jgi:hypothetical protein
VIADLDFALIDKRKAFMDSSGHHSRPELLSLLVDHTPSAYVHERVSGLPVVADVEESDHLINNQISCFGPDGLLRRQGYTVDILGGAPGLNYATDYREVDGIIIPAKAADLRLGG